MTCNPAIVELCTIRQETGTYATVGYNLNGERIHSRHGFTYAEILELVWTISKKKGNPIRVFGDVTIPMLATAELNGEFVPPAINIE